MNIAVIPARGGSKRIPQKNIKFFCGKPMISYAIETAKISGLFEQILVSTDDDEIADIAKQIGVSFSLKRPKDLADDYTPTVPVIAHAIKECEIKGLEFKNVCCIYPCVPFLKINDLITAFNLLPKKSMKYVFPVTKFATAIQRALVFKNKGVLTPLFSKQELVRSQDLKPTYHDVGQFYWGGKRTWLTINNIHSNSIGIEIPQFRVVDIDTPSDWRRAELIYKVLQNKEGEDNE